MKLNRTKTNKKITSLLFAALMITSVFAGFVTPVMATGEKPEGGIILGRVICYAGNPVAGASISVVNQMTGVGGWATTDADGNYTITGLATGTYEMRVHPPHGVNLAQAFTGFLITDIVVTAGETTILNVTMEKGGIISGRVICYAGDPVANAWISVYDQVSIDWKGWVWTDADGNYTIIGLAAGTYEMEVSLSYGVNLVLVFITNTTVTAGETTIVNVTLEEGGIISGRVICYAGDPVADASISVRVRDQVWKGVGTDADGNYTIIGLAADTDEMEVSPPLGVNLLPAFITNITVTAGETTIVNITLEKGGIISGRVICYAGDPVADASIRVGNQRAGAGGWATTDADGNYTITGLATGTYEMRVHPPHGVNLAQAFTGFLITDIVTDIVVTAGETTIVNVILEEGGIISGRVSCYAGDPVADTSISVRVRDQVWKGLWTDADGNYTITGLAAGIYEMKIRPPRGVNLLPAFITDIVVTAGETTTIDITLEEGGIISGGVTCYAGNSVANALISVWDQVTQRGWARTDADGNYTITGLATGTYEMGVSPLLGVNLLPAFITDIVVTDGETTIVNVTLEEGGIISGRVICYAGDPVVNAEIVVQDPETGAEGRACTDADGNYIITGLAAGTYEMKVFPPWGVYLAQVFITNISVTASKTTIANVTLEEGGIISGRVTCYAGDPVADAPIDVWNPETGAEGRAWTDADGNYTTTGVATGTYKMRVHPPYGINLALAFITDIVVTAGETTIVNVTMEKGGIISGRVICYAGDPVANARINVSDPVTEFHGEILTDADGNYTITGLAAGIYEMKIRPPRGVNLLPAFITDIVVTAGETTIVNVTMEVLPVEQKPASRIPGFGIIATILGIIATILVLVRSFSDKSPLPK